VVIRCTKSEVSSLNGLFDWPCLSLSCQILHVFCTGAPLNLRV